jgi:DNA-binding SARP family transcriptional activator
MARLQVRLLGAFEVRTASGPPLAFSTKKAQALLAYLAASPGAAHSRDALSALLWGDTPDVHARHSLRQTLFELRKPLARARSGVLVANGRTVALNASAVEVDVVVLERLIADGRRPALERAATLYRGELLEGLALREAPFERWLRTERERIRGTVFEALLKLLGQLRTAGAMDQAIQTGLRLLALDPLQERAHRTLMQAYAESGQRGAALRAYQVCVDVLQRELGVDPEPETKDLYQAILRQHGRGAGSRRRRPELQDILTPPPLTPAVGPLIGRAGEVRWLTGCLERAWRGLARQPEDGPGPPHVLVLRGEAGVGKTRLIDELIARGTRLGGRVLTGRFLEAEQVLPLRAWVDAFRTGAVSTDATVLRDFSPVWRAELGRLFPELGRPGLQPAPTREGWVRLFEVVTELVGHLASTRPLLLVLEDLHWADEMSLRLLAFVARRLGSRPVLLAATVREEDVDAGAVLRRLLQELEVERHVVVRDVLPLSRHDTHTLVRTLARVRRADGSLARLADRVWTASQGNPFVVVETVRALREAESADSAAGIPLPPRVREVIGARLDRLSRAARHLAEVAATIGSDFSFALVQRAAGLGAREAARAVEELVRRRVLDSIGEHFRFCHDRLRAVAADGILPPRRAALHAAIGEALEEVPSARGDDEGYDRLAHHFAQAGDPRRAFRYRVLLADQSLHRYAVEEAARILRDALGDVERLPAAARDRCHVDALLRQAFALSLLGRFREILELLLPHRDRVARLQDTSAAGPYYFRLAMTYSYLGDDRRSGAEAQCAIESATRGGDTSTLGKAHYVLALTSCWSGQPRDAVEHGRQAVALLEDTPERHWLGLACWVMALAHHHLGDFAAALRFASRVAAVGADGDDRRLQSFASFTVGLVRSARGEHDEAIEACRRAVALAPDPFCDIAARGYLALAYVESGKAADAIPALQLVIEALGRLGLSQVEARHMTYLAEAHLLQGELGPARAVATGSLELSQRLGARWVGALAQRCLGRIAEAAGDLCEAAASLERALEGFDAMGMRMESARTRLALASVAATQKETGTAAGFLAEALAEFTSLDVPLYAERARDLARVVGIGVPLRDSA